MRGVVAPRSLQKLCHGYESARDKSNSSHDGGAGLAVIKQGSVNGGDPRYLYIGQLTDESGNASVRIHEIGRRN